MTLVKRIISFRRYLIYGLIVSAILSCGVVFFPGSAKAELTYGTPCNDIGTFQTPWGNWCFWIGWDATFSETYTPTNETYCWVVYFAPEAIYVALQNGKGLYSAVNVNAGLDYFYGALNLATETRVRRLMLKDELHTVAISRNAFDVSGGMPGTGPFAQLSFSMSSGLTFLKEKTTGKVLRGNQISFGVSLALDLIKLPLPISVSLGIDDPDKVLGQFIGFYPVLIWDLPETTTQNPLDVMVSKLESDTSVPLPPYVQPVYSKNMEEYVLQAMRIMQASQPLREFIESVSHDSQIDGTINGTQQWLDSGDTSHLNLPEILTPPPPDAVTTINYLLAATQMSFETAYARAPQVPQVHTIYDDCVKTVHCAPGEPCRLEVTAEEIAALIPANPPLTAADLEGVWVGFDTTQEAYLTHDETEWVQMENGKAVYEFVQNTDTPVLMGVRISRYDLPQSIRDIQDKNLELCRRNVLFETQTPSSYTMTASVDGGHGTVAPASVVVDEGESQTFTATPNSGYTVKTWKVNGSVVQEGGTSYTLTDVQADTTILVSFCRSVTIAPWLPLLLDE